MPAQSPTLSPTLSAITAGLRGSSSGMPASTLPTRSAPTSAPLVKMPPPSRAKIEISEEPKARPTSGSMHVISHRAALPADQDGVEAGDAEQAEADDQHAGDGAAAEGHVQRRRSGRCVAASAVRTLARTDDVHADVAGGAGEHRADRRSRSR
jgi:hypothetical protein